MISVRSIYGGTMLLLGLCSVLQIKSFSQPAGYIYGKQITIDATEVAGGSSLTDFPVMIIFMGGSADNDLRTSGNGGHVENANGYDIVFASDQAGTTLLDHQIEYYDATLGEYVAWVKIPSLSNTVDTELFIFYGNCSVTTNPSTTDVWNSDFDAIYFLHNDFGDSTANVNTGTNSGSTDASPALIGDGQTFAVSSNDRVQVPSASITAGQGTISAWVYSTSFTTDHQYIFGHTTVPAFANRIQLYTNDNTGLLDLGLGNNHNLDVNFFDFNTDEWYYVTLTWDGTNYEVFVNGASETSGTYAGLSSLQTFGDIGNNGLASSRNEPWIGDIDHFRMSNEVFGDSWIETEYNNQRDGSTFYTVSSELSGTTYYSLTTGDWDDNNSWSLTSDGSSGALGSGIWPGRNDNTVIRDGHTITIDATDDNQACGISADGLGRSNVGTFTGSGDLMFYHTGDIIVSDGGTLSVSEEIMLEGYTLVEDGATFNITDDIINLGYLEVSTTATFNNTDDLILSGNSITILDNTSTGSDDLYIDWTDATLCGDGVYNLGNGGADPAIQFFNGATIAQVCEDFTVTCTMTCTGFPTSGSGGFISGNVGPGGVGDQNSNELWLRANDLSLSDGDDVTSWSDVSGNSLTATASGGGGTEPTFLANDVNSIFPSIDFDGTAEYLDLGQPAGLDFIPGTDSWSIFIVFNVPVGEQGTLFSKGSSTGSTRTYQYTVDDASGTIRFSSFIGGNLQIGGVDAENDWFVSSHSNNTSTRDSWTNESSNISADAIGTNSVVADVLIGARRQTAPSTGAGFLLEGRIAEIAMYNSEFTEAQRVIVTNYLAAKYDISLSANDVYDMDDNGNGDFDFEVAGIGRASDATTHRDAIGGILRMWNANGLDTNGEYLMWGHDNTALTATTSAIGTDVDGTVIEERLQRIWRCAEVGDVGNVSISIDFNGLSENPLGSNLRLMIDRDGDGFADNDVTPIEGSVSDGVAVFSGVDFQDGDRFTLGNTDKTIPLPIELISFSTVPVENEVVIRWSTGSEENNDFFTVERSINAIDWSDIIEHPGAGNSESPIDYQVTDKNPVAGISYYRLKQTDFDGKFSHSSISMVMLNANSNFTIYPNPSSDVFYVEFGSEWRFSEHDLVDLNGRTVLSRVNRSSTGLEVDLSGLNEGIYLLTLIDTQGHSQIMRLLKRD